MQPRNTSHPFVFQAGGRIAKNFPSAGDWGQEPKGATTNKTHSDYPYHCGHKLVILQFFRISLRLFSKALRGFRVQGLNLGKVQVLK